jgi:high-affinity iron transporter
MTVSRTAFAAEGLAWRFTTVALVTVAVIGCAPPPATRESLARGAALYRANGCGACHGPTGRGDGPAARALDPGPRDFRDRRAYRRGASADAIAETLAIGLPEGRGGMPAYDHLSAADRQALAGYVVSLQSQ